MSNETTIHREFWNGPPEELRELFRLSKPSGAGARCSLHSHFLGWEIKLAVNDNFVRSQVTRNPGEIDSIATEWRDALIAEGWKTPGA